MPPLEIATLKDKILKQLSDRTNKREFLEAIYINLNDTSIPKDVVGGYVYEMIHDGSVRDAPLPNTHTKVFIIEPYGEKILYEGGYVKILEKKIEDDKRIENDLQRAREKTRLEIANLKRNKWLSIIAIIFSFIALVVSVISIFRK